MSDFDEEVDLFGTDDETTPRRTHTIEGLTNDLEDVTDEQVADIRAEIKSRIPENKNITERDLNLDARRVYLGYTTIDGVIEVYEMFSDK